MGNFIKKLFKHDSDHEHHHSSEPELSEEQYADMLKRAIENQRQQKDAFFKTGQESPLSPEARQSFGGLNYYPVDPEYRVSATLERAAR